MVACDGRVTTVDACAAVNRTPPAASRSIHGVVAVLLPYAPTASARSVSTVMRRTFCAGSRRTPDGEAREHAPRRRADRTTHMQDAPCSNRLRISDRGMRPAWLRAAFDPVRLFVDHHKRRVAVPHFAFASDLLKHVAARDQIVERR